jgi:hypothetical protein
MEDVRRSSFRPRPPRMTVLLVSMITTLESRKPMLLIAQRDRLCASRVSMHGLGSLGRVRVYLVHKHQHALAPRLIRVGPGGSSY